MTRIHQKQQLRRAMIARMRAQCQMQNTSAQQQRVAQRICAFPQVRRARHVFVYVSYQWEVPTRMLIKKLLQQGKHVYIPQITSVGNMDAVALQQLGHTMIGMYGICTLRNAKAYNGKIDVALVPGVAFTHRGHRLGRGGGYYDRFFATREVVTRLGLAWQQQIVSQIPLQQHDYNVTDLVVFRCTPCTQFSPQNR